MKAVLAAPGQMLRRPSAGCTAAGGSVTAAHDLETWLSAAHSGPPAVGVGVAALATASIQRQICGAQQGRDSGQVTMLLDQTGESKAASFTAVHACTCMCRHSTGASICPQAAASCAALAAPPVMADASSLQRVASFPCPWLRCCLCPCLLLYKSRCLNPSGHVSNLGAAARSVSRSPIGSARSSRRPQERFSIAPAALQL